MVTGGVGVGGWGWAALSGSLQKDYLEPTGVRGGDGKEEEEAGGRDDVIFKAQQQPGD